MSITIAAETASYTAIQIIPAGPATWNQPSAFVHCVAPDCAAKLGVSQAHLDEPTVIAWMLVKGWRYEPAPIDPDTGKSSGTAKAYCRDHNPKQAAGHGAAMDWSGPPVVHTEHR